jgi:hypothetical protein
VRELFVLFAPRPAPRAPRPAPASRVPRPALRLSELPEFGLAARAAPNGRLVVGGIRVRVRTRFRRQPAIWIPTLGLKLGIIAHRSALPSWTHRSVLRT